MQQYQSSQFLPVCELDNGLYDLLAELLVLEEPLVGLLLEDAGVAVLEGLQDGLATQVADLIMDKYALNVKQLPI